MEHAIKERREVGAMSPIEAELSTRPSPPTSAAHRNLTARLSAFYLSRSRVLELFGMSNLPADLVHALRSDDGATSSALLSRAVSAYLLDAIAAGRIKTLHQLAFENELRPGVPFIYNGHLHGYGFGYSNKKPALALTEKLDGPLEGMKLVIDFSKNGLLNATAYTRLSGSTRLFAFGYVTDMDPRTIRAVPYVIGDLVKHHAPLPTPLSHTLELQPEDIAQFADLDRSWLPTRKDFARLARFPERAIKELICTRLCEIEVPKDWGGEECDVFSANLMVGGTRHTGAFLLKGPAAFHPMTPKDCGKNGDQIYRLFNIPADIYIVQHCHHIGAAVRKTVEAFALGRTFSAPCRYVIMDGGATARLLRASGRWDIPDPCSTG